ncbi:phosphatase PAP2 family protein [Deminuibacter soli]|uniref:Phosphatase PAP2 family protein n=1 Tax=Deminuibacter soli TaxID=2291815 RepID=A0A3E1NDK2_9BACT|nr:phosphatase PAP2 family protein [Deminuibacter soli]RFM25921.1 phosphatase PAP2 family protein [Deminuibacter soli]
MKKIIGLSVLVLAAAVAIPLACSKGVNDRTADIPALTPTAADADAGTWKPVLVARADTFTLAAPAAVNSVGYVAELNEIKGMQRSLSQADEDKIKYWSAGGVLRWNEILRGLVAKYNLPPYQNADGTYPAPNSANPFAYPLFPFANPPYAARAYAYISAAQYDALVVAWALKKKYNRAAPYQVDSTIQLKAGKAGVSAYPSEAAVLAGVNAEMMKLLFPTEIAAIEARAEEQERAAIAAGVASRSDIVAGEALGRQIAQLFLARGRADNAGKAIGTPTDWAKLVSDAQARGETPWYSLETPKRPPMLPLFGAVKPFLFDSATCVSLRPGPPPSTGSDQMKKETEEIYNYVKDASREHLRIVHFWADGAGTYAPPGHWDAIASEDFIPMHLSEVRWARNMALLNMSLMDAGIVCWNTKYYYYNPRPTQMDSRIKTLTGIPNFPSYISGHSTFSGAAATILGHLVPERAQAYADMAQEASMSRMYGGIHFRSDCTVGLTVGQNVGKYAIQRAQNDGAEK